MRGYIALSRVRKAHDLLFAQPFNPALFRQGPQPFPTLLLSVLKGEVTLNKLDDEIVATQKMLQHRLCSFRLHGFAVYAVAAKEQRTLYILIQAVDLRQRNG